MGVVPARTRAQRVLIETRAKVYPARNGVNRFVIRNGKIVRDKNNEPVGVDDPGGRGREIVREALACPACASSSPGAVSGLRAELGDHRDRADDVGG